MYLYVLEDYQRWANRGYTHPYTCDKHSWMPCLTGISPEGLYIKCGLCLYKRIIGKNEYETLEKMLTAIKRKFAEE